MNVPKLSRNLIDYTPSKNIHFFAVYMIGQAMVGGHFKVEKDGSDWTTH